jgi:hypothetical protein
LYSSPKTANSNIKKRRTCCYAELIASAEILAFMDFSLYVVLPLCHFYYPVVFPFVGYCVVLIAVRWWWKFVGFHG